MFRTPTWVRRAKKIKASELQWTLLETEIDGHRRQEDKIEEVTLKLNKLGVSGTNYVSKLTEDDFRSLTPMEATFADVKQLHIYKVRFEKEDADGFPPGSKGRPYWHYLFNVCESITERSIARKHMEMALARVSGGLPSEELELSVKEQNQLQASRATREGVYETISKSMREQAFKHPTYLDDQKWVKSFIDLVGKSVQQGALTTESLRSMLRGADTEPMADIEPKADMEPEPDMDAEAEYLKALNTYLRPREMSHEALEAKLASSGKHDHYALEDLDRPPSPTVSNASEGTLIVIVPDSEVLNDKGVPEPQAPKTILLTSLADLLQKCFIPTTSEGSEHAARVATAKRSAGTSFVPSQLLYRELPASQTEATLIPDQQAYEDSKLEAGPEKEIADDAATIAAESRASFSSDFERE